MADIKDAAIRGQDYEEFFRSLPYEQGIEVARIEEKAKFDEWCTTHGVDNPNFLWSAKQDYEKSLDSPSPSESKAQGEGKKVEKGRGHIKESNYFSWNDYMKRVEDESRKYAEEKAIEWNKSRDYSKSRSYFDAYGQAQRDFYNDYVKKNPKLSKILAKSMGNGPMRDALKRLELEGGIVGNIPSTKPAHEKIAEDKLKLIDKMAERKAKELSDPARKGSIAYTVALDQTRRGLLKNFADTDPVAFQHHINQQRALGKKLDSVMESVIAEKIRENAKYQETLARNQRRQQELLAKRGPAPIASAPTTKPSRINRLQNIMSGLKNGPRGLAKSALSYILRLFKRSFLGGIAGIISSFLTAAIGLAGVLATALLAGAISAATFAAAAFAKILALASTAIASVLAVFSLPGLAVIFVIALIIAIAAILFGPAAPGRSEQYSPYPGIIYSVNSNSPRVPNGQNIIYTIIVAYFTEEAQYPLDQVALVDYLPTGTSLVRSGTTGKFNSQSRPGNVIWSLSQNTPEKESEDVMSYKFQITLNPDDDITVENKIGIEVNGIPAPPDTIEDAGEGLLEGANSPPSNNTCGKYGGIMDDIKKYGISPANFGDPICNYSEERFKAVIELTEKNPDNVEFWLKIADCEGKSANAFAGQKGSGLGAAFGRLQMGRNSITKNKGDVPWQKQIQNAIFYNDTWINSDFSYWGTARCFCGLDKYSGKSYCSGIIRKGLQRTNCNNSCIN